MFDDLEDFGEKVIKVFLAFWVLWVILSVGMLGVAIWAIIKLVTHFAP